MRFAAFAALVTLPALLAPVLLVHGELHQVVPVSDAHRLAAAAPRARLLLVPDAICEFVSRVTQSRPAQAGGQPAP